MNTPSKPKKGQCGNPKRRCKREPESVATLIDEFFAREVDVVEDGESLRRSAFEVICLQLCNKAMDGNTRALNGLLNQLFRRLARQQDGHQFASHAPLRLLVLALFV